MVKKKKKKIVATVAAVVGTATAVVATYVFGHKPNVVTKPCYRSLHRADGRPKIAFDSAWRANWQSVKQLFLHGEVCNSYQVNDKFYTGHSRRRG
jgi:hypothetical protein